MQLDLNNPVVKLCARGMELEATGEPGQAAGLFNNAWMIAQTNLEKMIAAHYVARHQETLAEKLEWDLLALEYAHHVNEPDTRGMLPSFYLNIGKCYEDMGNLDQAMVHYVLAKEHLAYLEKNAYGEMIKTGVQNGISRIQSVIG